MEVGAGFGYALQKGKCLKIKLLSFGTEEETLFLISHMLTDLSIGKYKADKDAVICDAVTGDVLDLNMHTAELNLKHGSKLMLI